MTELMDPPDGGCKAWLVMLCSFTVNGVVFGIINTFGIIFVKLKENLEAAGVEEAAFKCSLVGSLAIGCTFFFSFLAGVLTDRMGLRTTSLTGSLLATLGLGLSAIFYDNIIVLYFTFGIMFGTGGSLVFNPSLSVLGNPWFICSLLTPRPCQVYTSTNTSEPSMESVLPVAQPSPSSSASSVLSSSTTLG